MTTNEIRRANQLRKFLADATRTEGEHAAARNLLARIESKVADRSAVKSLFTIPPIYAAMHVDTYV